MDPFFLSINIPGPSEKIRYRQPLLLVGSCFTEHIGSQLRDLKFDVLQNPNGILFDPLSVTESLLSYVDNRDSKTGDLFFLNDLWQSWHHHGHFSDTNRERCLDHINKSRREAHDFLAKADWLIITLGSAFSYTLRENQLPVANCHRAPADWFVRRLLTVEEILSAFDKAIYRLLQYNSRLKIVFTVSPVRHIREGVVENNRSKARLIEVVHHLAGKFEHIHYFPAYELVVDVLRDYRFYDKDLVHPNYQATAFVMEHFMQSFVESESRELAEEIRKIGIAFRHKALHPDTEAHRRFLREQYLKTKTLADKYDFLDFGAELRLFSGQD